MLVSISTCQFNNGKNSVWHQAVNMQLEMQRFTSVRETFVTAHFHCEQRSTFYLPSLRCSPESRTTAHGKSSGSGRSQRDSFRTVRLPLSQGGHSKLFRRFILTDYSEVWSIIRQLKMCSLHFFQIFSVTRRKYCSLNKSRAALGGSEWNGTWDPAFFYTWHVPWQNHHWTFSNIIMWSYDKRYKHNYCQYQ